MSSTRRRRTQQGSRAKNTPQEAPSSRGVLLVPLALALALAHSRDHLDFDEKVCTYWPEFAQAGKAQVTVRQLLAHQAGLCVIDETLTPEILADLDRLAEILAAQKPAWEPGTDSCTNASRDQFPRSSESGRHRLPSSCWLRPRAKSP